MKSKENRSGRQTKKWILDTSLDLFNQYGSQAISTKRIAHEMGISPGNLYYHFKNKEEIIRALLIPSGNRVEEHGEKETPLQEFLRNMNDVLSTWKRKPFFKRELYTLLQNDSVLNDWYKEIKQSSHLQFSNCIKALAQKDRIRSHGISVDSLFTTIWIIAEHWINYCEIHSETIGENNLKKGIVLMVQVLRPYLEESAIMEIDRFLENNGNNENME